MIGYVVTALAVVLNGGLVFALFYHLNQYWDVGEKVHLWVPFIPGQYAVLFLTLLSLFIFVSIGLSSWVDSIMKYLKNYRNMLWDEEDTGSTVLENVLYRTGTDVAVKLYILDSQELTSDYIGTDSIAISRKALKELSSAQLEGAVAHELGHLQLGHGIQIRVFFAVTILGQIALWVNKRGLIFLRNVVAAELPLVSAVAVIGFSSFRLLQWFIELFLVLPLMIGAILGLRQNEYSADKFVAQIGLGLELHAFLLEKMESQQQNMISLSNKLFQWLYSLIYPTPGQRLVQLEKITCKHTGRYIYE